MTIFPHFPNKWLPAAVATIFGALALAQTPVALSPIARQQFFDTNGVIMSGGKICTYAAGTTNALATYTDATGMTQNTNPVILDASGFAGIWLGNAGYKFVARLAGTTNDCTTGAIQWSVDGIYEPGQQLAGNLGSTSPTPASNGAALIGFQYPNASAGSTVQKVLQTINVVTIYGADPTGVASSTLAVQAGLNALTGGGILYFPPGTYKLAQLTIPSGVMIECFSKNGVNLNYVTNASPFIKPATAALNQQLYIHGCTLTNSGGDAAAVGLSMQGVWFSTESENRFSGWGTGISADGTSYGVYKNKVHLNEFQSTTIPILCTGGSGQSCNANSFTDNRATGFTTGFSCVAGLCEYNMISGSDFESPGAATAICYDLEGDNNTSMSNDCDAIATSGQTFTHTKVRGGGNTTINNKNSLGASGGTVIFLDRLNNATYGANTFMEVSNGNTAIYEFGDVVGGSAVAIKSTGSGPSLRVENMSATGSGTCYQWGLNAYSDGALYLQNLDCSLPVPNTNFNAAHWDTSGSMFPVKDINMPAGGVIRDSVYLNQTGTAANTDIVGQLTLVAGTATYSFTGTYLTAPICIASDTNAAPVAVQPATTTTTLTLTIPGASSTHVINYFCHGRT